MKIWLSNTVQRKLLNGSCFVLSLASGKCLNSNSNVPTLEFLEWLKILAVSSQQIQGSILGKSALEGQSKGTEVKESQEKRRAITSCASVQNSH